jgi:cell division septal protein FtsQ
MFSGVAVVFKAAAGFLAKALPTILVMALFTGLFFGVRQALYADAHLSIREIEVSPVTALSPERRQDLESRLMGKNILKVDLKQVARDLEKNPMIQSAQVGRRLPWGLKIGIQSRTQLAFIRFSPSGKYGLISSDGMILDVADEKNASLPLIEAYGLDIKQPRIGLQVKSKGYIEAANFLAAFWDHPVSKRETLTRLSLDAQGNVTITLGPGPDIRLGRHPATRLVTLEKMMYLLEGDERQNIEYIDLQFDNVIVKRKK